MADGTDSPPITTTIKDVKTHSGNLPSASRKSPEKLRLKDMPINIRKSKFVHQTEKNQSVISLLKSDSKLIDKDQHGQFLENLSSSPIL